jgi:hypothetical protein
MNAIVRNLKLTVLQIIDTFLAFSGAEGFKSWPGDRYRIRDIS